MFGKFQQFLHFFVMFGKFHQFLHFFVMFGNKCNKSDRSLIVAYIDTKLGRERWIISVFNSCIQVNIIFHFAGSSIISAERIVIFFMLSNVFYESAACWCCSKQCYVCPESTGSTWNFVLMCFFCVTECPASCASGVCSGDICCDKNCMGGCTGPEASQCIACKQVMVRDSNEFPRCAQRCAPGTYEVSFGWWSYLTVVCKLKTK